jgi:hypothetical protein
LPCGHDGFANRTQWVASSNAGGALNVFVVFDPHGEYGRRCCGHINFNRISIRS